MIIDFPTMIKYRGKNHCEKCAHCGNIWQEPEGMTDQRYFNNLSRYNKIDLVDYINNRTDEHSVNEWYIKEKYAICPFCGNFGTSITEDNFNAEMEKDNLEAIYLYMHQEHNSIDTLIDLYRFYEYKKDTEKAILYRTGIIKHLEREMLKNHDAELVMIISDLYRRNGNFDEAMKMSKELSKISKPKTEIDKLVFNELKSNIKEIQKKCKQKDPSVM